MIKKAIFLIILTFSIVGPLFSSELEKLWGISQDDLISRLKLQNYLTFKPEEKPEYNNRIIDFFSSMNTEDRAVINILRTGENPEIDYCFFNKKLYSISENWGNIDITRAGDLLKTIKGNYSNIKTENKDSYIVYSFKKNKTKGLLYKKVIDEKSVRIRIFYYSTDLFSMLFCE